MPRWFQLILVALAAVLLASLGNYWLVHWLRIGTGGIGFKILGVQKEAPRALAEGSSLMRDAISWQPVSDAVAATIENWFVAGSSPSEWEILQHNAPDVHLTFIAVSVYDLNEDFPCDYRANVVPLRQTIEDLRQSHSDWQFWKRLLSQYPLKYVRMLFPTVGRSDGVMVGLRGKTAAWLSPWMTIEAEAGPAVGNGSSSGTENDQKEKLTEWTQARLLRRIALMRTACGAKQRFDGPKKLALLRMVEQAHRQGEVVVIVLPVSGIYAREFLSPPLTAQFEATLAAAERAVPEARWVRLDQVTGLNSDDHFWDLVHLNFYGQQIATKAFLDQLTPTLPAISSR
jgi:hypothetical protein